jgi:hypothetical protein
VLPLSSELPVASERSKRARVVSIDGSETTSKRFKKNISPNHDKNINRKPGRNRKRDPALYYNSYSKTGECTNTAKGNVVLSKPSAEQVAIIGIDPGIRSPITAYFLEPATTDDAPRSYKVFQLTLNEWRHKSGITVATRQRALYHLKMEESLCAAEKALPSLKSLNLDDYKNHINCLQPIFSKLYKFYYSQPYLQLRSLSYSRRQRALANICNAVLALGGDAVEIIIGMGNFSQRPGSPVNKGHPSSPIKTIQRVISLSIIYFIYFIYFIYLFIFLFYFIIFMSSLGSGCEVYCI